MEIERFERIDHLHKHGCHNPSLARTPLEPQLLKLKCIPQFPGLPGQQLVTRSPRLGPPPALLSGFPAEAAGVSFSSPRFDSLSEWIWAAVIRGPSERWIVSSAPRLAIVISESVQARLPACSGGTITFAMRKNTGYSESRRRARLLGGSSWHCASSRK